MKREPQNIEDVLKQSWSSASQAQIDTASNRVLHQLRSQAGVVVEEPGEDSPSVPGFGFRWIAIVSAAAALLLAVTAWVVIVRSGPAPLSVVEARDGSLVNIRFGDTVRSNGKAGMFLGLPDGSRVEMRSQSELSLESANDGMRIRLNSGGVIVSAAKQHSGHLYVQTRDVIVSVVGTVFLVNAEEEGSRVAVIQGEVRVQQGAVEKKLSPGEQVATNPLMTSVPMIKELSWSQNAQAHLALLQQSLALLKQPVIAPPAGPPQEPNIPKWEAVSVKPCRPNLGTPGGRGGGGGGGGMGAHPGRLTVVCLTPMFMMQSAYVTFANPLIKPSQTIPISGGPGWMKSDLYSIEAKAEGTPTGQMMQGPMLQAILEDRFKLKIRRETREIPVYELTVDKSGLKIEPFKEGGCKPFGDPAFDERDVAARLADLKASKGNLCGATRYGRGGAGIPSKIDFYGMSLDEIAAGLLGVLDRPVVNKTGLTGLYHFHVDFQLDQTTNQGFLNSQRWPGEIPDDVPTGAPFFFKALQEQLGLRLEPAKAPGDFLLIESIERPTEN